MGGQKTNPEYTHASYVSLVLAVGARAAKVPRGCYTGQVFRGYYVTTRRISAGLALFLVIAADGSQRVISPLANFLMDRQSKHDFRWCSSPLSLVISADDGE